MTRQARLEGKRKKPTLTILLCYKTTIENHYCSISKKKSLVHCIKCELFG